MPVTAKLSGKFYERLGDDIVNELVDWFNAVDSTYQAQLKELNDLNWGRIDTRFVAIDVRFDAFEAKIAARFAEFEARMDAFGAKIDAKLARQKTELILWMFGFWSATVIPIVGVMLALSGAFRR